ncbi:MAG: hypothetical protein JWM14_2782 [Chitinophagaceae bacterium]|nr:hypothetical protein [Chitinophagaceae bacterium]
MKKYFLVSGLICILLVGGFYIRSRNVTPDTNEESHIYKNSEYGFEIATKNYLNIPPPTPGMINQYSGSPQMQYEIDTSEDKGISVTIIKKFDLIKYIELLKQDISSDYLIEEKTININGMESKYIQLGYASRKRNHEYFFQKGKDIFWVAIFIDKSESPDRIINSFKFD